MTAGPPSAPEPEPLDALAQACAGGDAPAALDAAARATAALIGWDLFTVMRFDVARWEVERLHSSMPDVYPVGGRKAKRDTPWCRRVLGEGRAFRGGGPAAIAWAFDDAATILALGLDQVLNMPALRDGRVVGTVNVLRAGAPYRDADVVALRRVATLLAPTLSADG